MDAAYFGSWFVWVTFISIIMTVYGVKRLRGFSSLFEFEGVSRFRRDRACGELPRTCRSRVGSSKTFSVRVSEISGGRCEKGPQQLVDVIERQTSCQCAIELRNKDDEEGAPHHVVRISP